MSKTSLSGTLASGILLLSTVFAMPAEPRRPPQSTLVRPKITGVAGIAVKTNDMAAARNFYSTILGLDEAFATRNPMGGADFTTFKINERQYVYVSPGAKDDADSRLWYVSFETTDARALRTYLADRGLSVPAAVDPDPEGNLSFIVKDPEGQDVQFIQYLQGSVHGRNAGRFLSSRRLSNEALHVGYRIRDADKVDAFYKDILGFRLMWKGGSTENQFRWISMVVPDGTEWLEYMVDTGTPSPRTLGIWNHLAFGTLDQQSVAAEVKARGYAAAATPKIGRDGRWLMDLYDADLTRVEFMVRKPVQTPCCSPLVDPADRPGAAGPVGIFEDHRDIGTPATIGGGSTTYDAATKTYTVRGGGENMWARADHFQYAWKKHSGDLSFSATIRFTGTEPAGGTPDQHRKACLLLRQTLDDDGAYVDAARHGNGMTALQWRASKGDLSHDIETNVVGPSRVRIDRRGDNVSMFVAEPGQPWRPAGGATRVHLTGEYYIGIGVSSHATTQIDTATFSDIVIETPPPLTKASLVSTVETISLNSRDRRVAYVVTQPDPVQAPIWLPDGTSVLVFRSGKKAMKVLADLPRAPLSTGGPRIPEPLVGALRPAAPGRSDYPPHVAPDGTEYFESTRGGSAQIWRMKDTGSAAEQVTTDGTANWSPQITPDGKFLVFLTMATGAGRRERFDVTLRRMNLADGSIEDLTAFLGGRGSVGATAIAPTGQHMVFVSYQLVSR